MKWVELAPHEVAESIVHVVMPGILVRIALFGVALEFKALDQALASVADL